jgi:hypothetical protein
MVDSAWVKTTQRKTIHIRMIVQSEPSSETR